MKFHRQAQRAQFHAEYRREYRCTVSDDEGSPIGEVFRDTLPDGSVCYTILVAAEHRAAVEGELARRRERAEQRLGRSVPPFRVADSDLQVLDAELFEVE